MTFVAPLDYRYALDAVMPACASSGRPVVISNLRELDSELEYRELSRSGPRLSSVALWIEPLVDSWSGDLSELSSRLCVGGTLYVMVSQPLARLLPERKSWQGKPLGMRIDGNYRLSSALTAAGFQMRARYGIHGFQAIGLNTAGRIAEYFGRSDISDRLNFASRIRYCTRGPLSSLSTVSLIEASKLGRNGIAPQKGTPVA